MIIVIMIVISVIIAMAVSDCSKNNGECYINETCSNVTLKFSSISTCRCSDGFQRNKTWENCTG